MLREPLVHRESPDGQGLGVDARIRFVFSDIDPLDGNRGAEDAARALLPSEEIDPRPPGDPGHQRLLVARAPTTEGPIEPDPRVARDILLLVGESPAGQGADTVTQELEFPLEVPGGCNLRGRLAQHSSALARSHDNEAQLGGAPRAATESGGPIGDVRTMS